MSALRRLLWWIRGRVWRGRIRREVDEDIRTHIELDAERLRAEGLDADEALGRARERFGNGERIRSEMLVEAGTAGGAQGGTSVLESVALHIRQGARAVRTNAGPTSLVVAILATAIAVNTLMVAVANSVLLGNGGVSDPDRVVTVYALYPQLAEGQQEQTIHPLQVARIEEVKAAQAVAGFKAGYFNLTGHGMPRRLTGMVTTPRLFDVAGVHPMLGAGFGDVTTGHEHVVVLSWGLWRDLGANPSLLGSVIQLNDEPYTVVGVMPPGFAFPRREDGPSTFPIPRRPDIWVPYALPERGPSDLGVVARLRPGATRAELEGELAAAQTEFQKQIGQELPWSLRAVETREEATAPIRPAMLLLLVATGLVVLVAMGNVVGVGIARGEARAGELAVRMALGAGRAGAAAFVLAESLVIGLVTAVVGFGLAGGLGALVRWTAPEGTPGVDQMHLSLPLGGFTLLLSLVGALCLAAGSMVRVRRWRVGDLLRGARSAGGRTTRRSGLVLVAVELATTLVLLSGATLMARTVLTLLAVDPGFQPDHVFTAELTLPEAAYPDTARTRGVQRATPPSGPDAAVPQFHRQLIERLSRRPGIVEAAVANPLPFSGGEESSVYWVEGMAKPDHMDIVDYTVVSEGYFEAMGIPLVAGREFNASDHHDGEQVVIVSASLAKLFPDGKALGGRMKLGGAPEAPYPWLRVVGVVPDVKRVDLTSPAHPEMYVHESQGGYTSLSTTRLVVRVADGIDVTSTAATVRSAVAELDPNVPVPRMEPMSDLPAASMSRTRFAARLVLGFSFLGLLITALGLYSAISYAVTTRRRELALRTAVGATSRQVLGSVLTETLTALVAGVGVGGVAMYLGSGLLNGVVYGVAPFEPVSLAVAAGLLCVTVLVAALGPARVALGMDPARVLSQD